MNDLPSAFPCVRYTANNWAEHESGDKGEEHEVDEAFQSIITQTRHGLDVVLQQREAKFTEQYLWKDQIYTKQEHKNKVNRLNFSMDWKRVFKMHPLWFLI